MRTDFPMNFPEKVLKFCTPRANPLDSMSADALRDAIRAGRDSRSHFEALFRQNRARQLNSVPSPFLGGEAS